MGGAGSDTYRADQTTLTAGDVLTGSTGNDTLAITTTGVTPAGFGTGVTSTGVETIRVTATGGTATLDASGFKDVTTVSSSGSITDVIINNLTAIPAVGLTATSSNMTVGVAAAAVAGTADSATITLDGVATSTTGNTVSINGIETLNIATNGTASGSTTAAVTIDATASPNLTTVNLSGSAAGRVAVTLGGATTTVTGTVTSGDAAHDVAITADATDKISVSMGGGNDTVRLGVAPGLASGSTTVGAWTVDGGPGTDTLVAAGFGVSSATTTGGNISGFEKVAITGGVSVSLSTTTNTISEVTFDASGGTLNGLAAGATVIQAAGGSATVSNTTGWTGTSDNLAVTVGTATTSGAITQSLSAALIDTATITNLALSTDLTSARSVGVTSANLKTLTVTGTQPTTITGGGALVTTVDASGVSGNVTLNAGTGGTFTVATAGASITSAAGNDTITGGAGADTITSGAGNDNITAGDGNDVVTAADGNDTIDLGKGNDSVDGGTGNDTITAGEGADTMTGGTGADTFIIGGPNTATASFSTAVAPDVIKDFLSGTDKISVGQTNSEFRGNFASLSLGLANMTGTNQSFFVTSENQLYVVAGNGTYAATDTVVKLENVTSITKEDLGFGSQPGGNSVTIAGGAGTVTTATRSSTTIVSALTTDLDDTITLTVAGLTSGNAIKSDITGGAGRDTVNITTTAAGLTVLNDATSATGIALSGVEVVNISVSDTLGGVVSLTNAIPTTVESITVTGANAGLTATFTAANQTFNTTANTTLGGNASTITFDNLKGLSATTGSADDVFQAVQADYTTITGGAGNDTVNLTSVNALGSSSRLAGGTQSTGGVDTLAFTYQLASAANVNLKTLVDTSVISGFEYVTFTDTNVDDSAHTITLADGFTRILVDSDNVAEKWYIKATAAQATGLTSIVDTTGTGTTELEITTAGTVSLSSDTTTNLDAITWEDLAVTLTLNNSAHSVVQGATTPGTAAQTVTFGTLAADQTANIASTGTVTFNVPRASLTTIAAGKVSGAGTNGTEELTITAAASATASVNVTGTGGTFQLAGDADVIFTAVDVVNVNTSTASTIIASQGTAEMVGALNLAGTTSAGADVVGHKVHLDTVGTQDAAVTIRGFAAGASGDQILLSQATDASIGTTGLAAAKILPGISVTGISCAGWDATVADAADLIVLSGSSFQINGALTATTSGAAVSAAIIAAGLIADGTARFGYVVLDNGTSTGIYRVELKADNGGASNTVIDSAADVVSIQLVGVLEGVADSSTLVAGNFGG